MGECPKRPLRLADHVGAPCDAVSRHGAEGPWHEIVRGREFEGGPGRSDKPALHGFERRVIG